MLAILSQPQCVKEVCSIMLYVALCYSEIEEKHEFELLQMSYNQTSNIRHTKSQNLNVSCLALQLSLCNLLKPGVKLRIKM